MLDQHELARSRSRIVASQRRADRHAVIACAINQQTSQVDHLSPQAQPGEFRGDGVIGRNDVRVGAVLDDFTQLNRK